MVQLGVNWINRTKKAAVLCCKGSSWRSAQPIREPLHCPSSTNMCHQLKLQNLCHDWWLGKEHCLLVASGFPLCHVGEEQFEEQKAVGSCPPSRLLCISRGTAAFLRRVQSPSALPQVTSPWLLPPFKHLFKGDGSALAFSDFSAALNILVLYRALSASGFLTSTFSWPFRFPSVSPALDSVLWGVLVELTHSQTQFSSLLLIMLLRLYAHLLSFPFHLSSSSPNQAGEFRCGCLWRIQGGEEIAIGAVQQAVSLPHGLFPDLFQTIADIQTPYRRCPCPQG